MIGSARKVESLPVAIQRLGCDEVVRITLAASLQARTHGRDVFAEQKRKLWERSVACAFIARALAARTGLDANTGFLCGLLMDFGMSVLYSLIQDIIGGGTFPAKIVAEIIRDYHPRVGRVVGRKWSLPQAVVEAMERHHSIEMETNVSPYVAVAALADSLASFALEQTREELEASLDALSPEELAERAASRLIKLNAEKAAAILKDLPRQIEMAAQFVAA